ncbi:MAG: hypothetical protein O7G85_01975 [Planctomycetota bacterium]|nr:hypothetical protein [Planctomycetota bacterium]
MSSDILLYWFPFVAMIAIVVFSTYMLWKALFADRSKGRRRCPKCWYDMAYSEGLTCSECGHVTRRESDFSRTRRHRGRAVLALFVSVFTILGGYWKLTERGFIASMPTSVLIAAFPLVQDSNSEVMRVMARRMMMNQVDAKHIERIVMRCAGGDWMLSPPDDGWIAKYGAFLNPIRAKLPAQRTGGEFHDLEKLLLDIPARVFLETNGTWPKGNPARIRVRTAEWWPIGYEIKLTITNVDDPDDFRSIVQRPDRNGSNVYVLNTPPLDESFTKASYDIEVFRRRTGLEETWQSMSVDRHTIPINVSESYETAIEAVSTEEMTEAVKSVFTGAARWTGGPQPVRFHLQYNPTYIEDFDGVAFGVTVELLHDGEVARQLDLWWSGGPDRRQRRFGHEVPFEDVATLLSIETEDLAEHWKFRVRSDPALALRAGNQKQYWKGEFTIDVLGLRIDNKDVRPKPLNRWHEENQDPEAEVEEEVAR